MMNTSCNVAVIFALLIALLINSFRSVDAARYEPTLMAAQRGAATPLAQMPERHLEASVIIDRSLKLVDKSGQIKVSGTESSHWFLTPLT
jgi:hypothetical protein